MYVYTVGPRTQCIWTASVHLYTEVLKINTIVLHDLWLVEPEDVELWIHKADYKVTQIFNCAGVGAPTPELFKGLLHFDFQTFWCLFRVLINFQISYVYALRGSRELLFLKVG